MFRIRLPGVLLLCILIGQSTGCASEAAPTVRVTGARVMERGDDALVLGIQLALNNPNDKALVLGEIHYHTTVNGASSFTGRRSAEIAVPPGEEAEMEIPAVVRYAEFGWSRDSVPAELNYAIAGEIEYGAPGRLERILFESGLRQPRVSFTGGGRATTSPE